MPVTFFILDRLVCVSAARIAAAGQNGRCYLFTFRPSYVCRAANKLISKGCAMRSYYTNPLARVVPNAEAKTFRIFTSAASAAHWLKEPSNAKRVIRVRTWKDGHVAVTYHGSLPRRPHFKLAPARELSPALYANENYDRLARAR